MGQKHLCEQAGQPGEESFKIVMMGEGEDDQQSCEEAADKVRKQNVRGDANSEDLVINNTGLKGAIPKHIRINKEVPFRIRGKTLVLFLGNQHGWLPL